MCALLPARPASVRDLGTRHARPHAASPRPPRWRRGAGGVAAGSKPWCRAAQAVVRSIQAFLSAGAPRVRALGGARFDPAAAPAAEWAPFGSFCLLLPRLELLEAATCSLLACTLAWRPKPDKVPQHVATQPAAGRAGWGAAGGGAAPGVNGAASGGARAGGGGGSGGGGGGAAGAGPASLAEAAAAALAALAAAQAPAPPSAPSLQVPRPPPPHVLPTPGPCRLSRAPRLSSFPRLKPCACACMQLLHSPPVQL
jgi:hypothetical protein